MVMVVQHIYIKEERIFFCRKPYPDDDIDVDGAYDGELFDIFCCSMVRDRCK